MEYRMEIDNMSGSTPSDNLRDETSSLENVEPTLFSHPTILSRIEEYRTDSLLKPHNLQACLGATTAGLLKLGHYLELRIIRALETAPDAAGRIPQIMPTLETHLRLTRQIDRYAQMELRVEEAQQREDEIKAKLQLASRQPTTGGRGSSVQRRSLW
jgi:hypothetical protein